uniref:Uncharacterized protein n=1 Tax=Anguilla anguilla TaxID=7936 RepID=A0A0E9W5Q0_ANGAN
MKYGDSVLLNYTSLFGAHNLNRDSPVFRFLPTHYESCTADASHFHLIDLHFAVLQEIA